jgi:hypothetical protein
MVGSGIKKNGRIRIRHKHPGSATLFSPLCPNPAPLCPEPIPQHPEPILYIRIRSLAFVSGRIRSQKPGSGFWGADLDHSIKSGSVPDLKHWCKCSIKLVDNGIQILKSWQCCRPETVFVSKFIYHLFYLFCIRIHLTWNRIQLYRQMWIYIQLLKSLRIRILVQSSIFKRNCTSFCRLVSSTKLA